MNNEAPPPLVNRVAAARGTFLEFIHVNMIYTLCVNSESKPALHVSCALCSCTNWMIIAVVFVFFPSLVSNNACVCASGRVNCRYNCAAQPTCTPTLSSTAM